MTRQARDHVILGFCAFSVLMASTVELWWLLHADRLPTLHGWLPRAFRFYGIGDRGYYDQVSRFELTLETVHIVVTQWLYVVMAWCVLRRAVIRYPLQLILGSYVAYSVVLYFTAKHMTGYVQTPVHDWPSMLVLFVPNLPWLLGSLFLAIDAGIEIARAVGRLEMPAGSAA